MSPRGKLKLVVLISGRGTNLTALAQACRDERLEAEIVLVISDQSQASGLDGARNLGLPTAVIEAKEFADRALFEAALAQAIDKNGAELLVLAGFMRILSAEFVQRYAGRVLNIHPSLLPKYKGLHTHRRVLESAEREHGVSVHFVTGELDGGPVICQARVPVYPGDTEQALAARVLLQEHRIYPMVVGLIAAGRLALSGTRILLDGRVLQAPLSEDAPHEKDLQRRG
jgi:phosphoribosylglycinamide formyltransferase-1